MIKHRASYRYAQAFFDLCREKKCLDKVYPDTQSLDRLLKQSTELKSFMENPEIASKKRLAIFKTLFKDRMNLQTYHFLLFLEQKDRLNLAGQICEEFETLYLKHKNILKVGIDSARELDKKHIHAIAKRLNARFQKEIQPKVTIVPSLIAGFKIHVGHFIYDLSIASQLKKFKEHVLSV